MGLVRAGLERNGICTTFANDVDLTKAALYRDNWGDDALLVRDIREVHGRDVPCVDVATSSFPCVDLSIAGARAGLAGKRSGLVYEFCRVIGEMKRRAPRALVIENVPGFLTANGGRDFRAVQRRLNQMGYATGVVVLDAAAFLPQSRARVFVLALRGREVAAPLVPPPDRTMRLADVADRATADWWRGKRRTGFFASLSPIQAARIKRHHRRPRMAWFGAYRRTRRGRPVWEVRADELAGALRTTQGGSSRQAIVRCGGRRATRVRWMSVREYARLQGAQHFRFGAVSERQALYALGDAVCVPVVEWLAREWICKALR